MKKAPTVFLLWVSICFAFAQGEYIDCQSKKKAFLQLTSMLREQSSIYKLSDTLDVLQYTISLNFDSLGLPTVAAKTLRGNTVVKLKPKINGINKITLMLYKLTIDSIKVNNTIAPYTYDNTLIRISTAALSTNDTLNVQVFYKGKPQQNT